MTDNNKQTLIDFAKVVSLFLLAGIVFIPNIEIWNMKALGYTDGFHVLFSWLNIAWGTFAGIIYAKKIGIIKKKVQPLNETKGELEEAEKKLDD